MPSFSMFICIILVPLARAAVSVLLDPVPAQPLGNDTLVTSAYELWSKSCPEENKPLGSITEAPKIIVSSYDYSNHGLDFPANTHWTSSSFVRSTLDAWTQHRHLEIRPDEVWFEILAQLNFYMTAHANDTEVRSVFIDHEGKEEIFVQAENWPLLLDRFGQEIQDRTKTDWLLDWVLPGFTTSQDQDRLTATVLLMGLMQHYFDFAGEITCGIPSVTLLGEREDWAALLVKTDRLAVFGAEPADYGSNLKTLLSRFVQTFDEPESAEVRDFWRSIVNAREQFSCGGPNRYDMTGWLGGFLQWGETGFLKHRGAGERIEGGGPALAYEDLVGVQLDVRFLPVGYAKAPLKIVNYPEDGVNTTAYILAGNIGKEMRRGVPELYVEAVASASAEVASRFADRQTDGDVTVRPFSSWYVFGPVDWEADPAAELHFGSFDELVGLERSMDPLGSCVERPSPFIGLDP